MDATLSRSIYIWAKDSPERQSQISEWIDAAMVELASGRGRELQSTTANGISVSFMSSGITIAEWFKVLTQAQVYIESQPTSKIVGIFR